MKRVITQLTVVLAVIVLQGCGKSGGDQKFPDQPPKGPPTGIRLFESTLSQTQLDANKRAFLAGTQVTQTALGRFALNNRYVVYHEQPYSPVVFGYVSHTPGVLFTARLPDDFRFNLPSQIIDLIKSRDVDSLEIFFTPQQFDGDGFKPQVWAAENVPAAFTGSIYSQNLEMAIVDADYPIDRDLVNAQLRTFGVSIHDNTISPVQPQLRISASRLPLSFWSLVIDPARRRAAVTLHWLLFGVDNAQIAGALLADYPGGNFNQFITRMAATVFDGGTKGRVFPFAGVTKLQSLIR